MHDNVVLLTDSKHICSEITLMQAVFGLDLCYKLQNDSTFAGTCKGSCKL